METAIMRYEFRSHVLTVTWRVQAPHPAYRPPSSRFDGEKGIEAPGAFLPTVFPDEGTEVAPSPRQNGEWARVRGSHILKA